MAFRSNVIGSEYGNSYLQDPENKFLNEITLDNHASPAVSSPNSSESKLPHKLIVLCKWDVLDASFVVRCGHLCRLKHGTGTSHEL